MTTSSPSTEGEGDERFHIVIPSPVGPLLIVARNGAVVGVYHEHHDPAPTPCTLGQGTNIPGNSEHHGPSSPGALGRAPSRPTLTVLAEAARELREYFEGSRREFGIRTSAQGTPFQAGVWAALAEIPYGERRSYREIAAGLGNPAMGRAVGAAVRANPLSIITPGHRVVSTTGKVVGYAAGTEAKTALLELEQPSRPLSATGDR